MNRYTFIVDNEPDIIAYCDARAAKLKGSKADRFVYEINREALGMVLRPLLLEFKIRRWRLRSDGKFSCRLYARFTPFYERGGKKEPWLPVPSDPEGADLELKDAMVSVWNRRAELPFVEYAALEYIQAQGTRILRGLISVLGDKASIAPSRDPGPCVEFSNKTLAYVKLGYRPFPASEQDLVNLPERLWASRVHIHGVSLDKLVRIFAILAE